MLSPDDISSRPKPILRRVPESTEERAYEVDTPGAHMRPWFWLCTLLSVQSSDGTLVFDLSLNLDASGFKITRENGRGRDCLQTRAG